MEVLKIMISILNKWFAAIKSKKTKQEFNICPEKVSHLIFFLISFEYSVADGDENLVINFLWPI